MSEVSKNIFFSCVLVFFVCFDHEEDKEEDKEKKKNNKKKKKTNKKKTNTNTKRCLTE